MANAQQEVTPRDFESLKTMIVARQPDLPKRLAQTAEFVVRHPEEMALGTAASIARQAGVQPSTLVRLAQAFGFSGFSDLQDVFRNHLRGRGDHTARLEALSRGGAAAPGVLGILRGITDVSVGSLEILHEAADPANLDRAVAILARADTIYLLGQRRAFPVSAYLAYALAKLDVKSVLVDNIASMAGEQIGFAGPDDAVLAISFTPYTPATVELSSLARRSNVPVVAVTDSPFSPLVAHSTCWIEVAEADFAGFRSLAATFSLAMALAIATGERRASDRKSRDGKNILD